MSNRAALLGLLAACGSTAPPTATPPPPPPDRDVIIVVWDGLRSDALDLGAQGRGQRAKLDSHARPLLADRAVDLDQRAGERLDA